MTREAAIYRAVRIVGNYFGQWLSVMRDDNGEYRIAPSNSAREYNYQLEGFSVYAEVEPSGVVHFLGAK